MSYMRDYLTEREIYILRSHPSKSYAKLGEELGITGARVKQIKTHAERVILLQKHREQAAARGEMPVELTLRRKDLYVLLRALEWLYFKATSGNTASKRRDNGDDPDIAATQELMATIKGMLRTPAAMDTAPDGDGSRDAQ